MSDRVGPGLAGTIQKSPLAGKVGALPSIA